MKLTKKIIIISFIALSFYTKVQENPTKANQNLIIASDNESSFETAPADKFKPHSLDIITAM